jgi:hypothetical protein
LVCGAAALAGCGDDDRGGGGGGGSTPIPQAMFCDEFVDAMCDRVERCDCGTAASTMCRTSFGAECGGSGGFLGPEVQARITAGTVRYDAAAAGRLVAGLRADTGCGNPVTTLGWRFSDVLTFGGVLTGTKAAGEACAASGDNPFGSECANGVCAEVSEGTNRCIGFAGMGSACGREMPILCANLSAPFTDFEDSSVLLRCDETTMQCAARLADGAMCSSREDCASQNCDASGETPMCAPKLADGMPCEFDAVCASGYCDYDVDPSVCAAKPNRPLGAACNDDSQCASGTCMGDRCVNETCGIVSVEDMMPTPPAT